MGKMLLTPVILCMVALLSMLWMPAASATTLKCDQIICYDDWGVVGPNPNHLETDYWKGNITGGITGTCYFWETDKNYVVGAVEHFFEDFYIDLGNGEWVSGHDEGVWNFATFKFRASGWITDASGNYEYMIGCKFHEEGTTTNPDAGLPIVGVGTCFIGPQTGHVHGGATSWLRLR